MFTPRKLHHYFSLLPKKLQKRYGIRATYNAHQVRATVFHCDFNPNYLPLGYVLFLPAEQASAVIQKEFPDFSMAALFEQINQFTKKKPEFQAMLQLSSLTKGIAFDYASDI
jgi:hypothetical protein